MSTQTAKNKLIAVKRVNAEDFVNLLSEIYDAILIAYDIKEKKLLYTPELLASALGYETTDLGETYFSFEEVLHTEDATKFIQVLNLLNEGKDIPDIELRLLHKDGAYRQYRLGVKQRSNGRLVMLLFVNAHTGYVEMDEISKLKKAKAEVIDELQRSNKELEEFAYSASHDLQEPLRKISTFSGRLADKFTDELNEEGKLYIRRIMASAENMRILIDNLLEFSRISRIKQPFAPLNLNFVLHQVKAELELSIEETGTKIHADGLPKIDASLTQMKQLFNNIINNAIKFHKPGVPPEITIVTHKLSSAEKNRYKLIPDKVYYAIRFCDNGIGFENEYAAKIFQIFQRLHGKSDYPGSGIGLAICKKIVDHHQGVIFAENVPDKGACFTIILPERLLQ